MVRLVTEVYDFIGWDEGVLGMQVGEVARLTVSFNLLLSYWQLYIAFAMPLQQASALKIVELS